MVSKSIPIEVSARHVHLTADTFTMLFGQNASLTKLKDLSQPGEFASEQTVTLKGPKGALERVRILGPFRDYDQVEVSKTDCYTLGVQAPVVLSGNPEAVPTPGIKLVGSAGSVDLPSGLIVAKRHLHASLQEAQELGVTNGQIISVKVEGERGLVFDQVVSRVSENYRLALHLDTDEGNAGGITTDSEGGLVL